MNYRDLTGDDVLQAGDEQLLPGFLDFRPVSDWKIGRRVYEWSRDGSRYRRPPSSAEITAANRVKFEAWFSQNHSISMKRILPPNCDPRYFSNTMGHYWHSWTQSYWETWCAAVNCDPMGDV